MHIQCRQLSHHAFTDRRGSDRDSARGCCVRGLFQVPTGSYLNMGWQSVRSAAVVSKCITPTSSMQSTERVPGFDNATTMAHFGCSLIELNGLVANDVTL
eukprot:358827-Chlamydomonas_euryale.AAC.3